MIFIADWHNHTRIGSVTAEIPSGFTEVTVLTVKASSQRLWSGSVEYGKIRLEAANGGNELAAGDYVAVTFSAKAPDTAGWYEWNAKGYEGRGWAGDLYVLLGIQPTVVVIDNR